MTQQEETEDNERTLSFAELTRRMASTGFAPPLSNAPELPLRDLEPAVLERLAAELVYRNDRRSVQFYGRSGQTQHGLDVVEHRTDGGYTLYQGKRYQQMTPAKLREAVEVYAGPARSLGHGLPPRRFGADRFVVVTSAAFDADTANVDALEELRREYAGDLKLDVWASEALSRRLREVPRVVYAVFGPAWAKEFCAFEPSAQEAARPRPLGLVEDPAEVLGLQAVLAEADAAEPARAAVLHRAVADELAEGRLPRPCGGVPGQGGRRGAGGGRPQTRVGGAVAGRGAHHRAWRAAVRESAGGAARRCVGRYRRGRARAAARARR